MITSSALVSAFALASWIGFVKADAGCSTVLDTANEAGLGALAGALTGTGALGAAAESLGETEIGAVILGADVLPVILPEGQRVTIFAPTDAAFEDAAQKFGGELPPEALADVLLNHVVPQEITSTTITEILAAFDGPATFETINGGEIKISSDGMSIFVQSQGLEAPGAKVIVPDQITCAGPVHVIDAVLLPTMPDGSVIDLQAEAPDSGVAPDEVTLMGALTPELATAPGPATTERGFVFDYGYDFLDAPYEAPSLAPLGDEPSQEPPVVPLGDEPMAFPPIISAIAPLGDEPVDAPIVPLGDEPIMIAPLGDEPIMVSPLGDEPMEGPLGSDLMESPAEDPAAGPGSIDEAGLADRGAPAVQGETASACAESILFSALAVGVASLVLLAA